MSKLMDKIESLKKTDLNCNVFSVYDYCGLSMQDLLNQFFTKINNCIDISNKTINIVEWLVNEGLKLEVAKKFEEWLQDGTFSEIINNDIFSDLNLKINVNENEINLLKTNFSEIENRFNDINDNFNNVNNNVNNMENTIIEHGNKINQNTQSIETIKNKIENLPTNNIDIPINEININSNVLSTKGMIDLLKQTSIENNKRNVIRIGTFNILSFKEKNVKKTTQSSYLILKSKLDICGIQEMQTFYDFNSLWWTKIPNAYDYLEFNPLFNVNGGDAGLAFLSHHNISDVVHGKYVKQEGYEQRGYIKVSLLINGKKINVYNTHLTHNNMTLLRNEMKELANIIKLDSNPYKIIVGDFNTRTLSDYKPFTDIGYNLAYPLSTDTIDNILYPSNMRVIKTEKIISGDLSDHDLIIGELEVL